MKVTPAPVSGSENTPVKTPKTARATTVSLGEEHGGVSDPCIPTHMDLYRIFLNSRK